MNLGLDYLTNNYYMNQINQQRKTAEQNSSVGFNGILSAKAVESAARTEQSFKDMWQTRFPGGYYHVMDAYKIPQNVWERLDFPHEKFFSSEVDESVLNWQPAGAAPKLSDSSVQSRLNSVLGKNSIVVPPALEEKLKNNPELADKIMANIDNLFASNGYPSMPDGMHSALIVLDENGEVAHWQLVGAGFMGPSDEELRRIEEEEKAKQEKREEYARLMEESAKEKKEKWHETNAKYYQSNLFDRAIRTYEMNFMSQERVVCFAKTD